MQHLNKGQKAKTYLAVELMVLLLVIAAVAFFAIPKLTDMLNHSRQVSADNDAKIIAVAAEAWLIQQEVAEIIPIVLEGNILSEGDMKQIVEKIPTIEKEVADTVVISVKGDSPPTCYRLASVVLTKKKALATVTK